jgi:hypothetical protein
MYVIRYRRSKYDTVITYDVVVFSLEYRTYDVVGFPLNIVHTISYNVTYDIVGVIYDVVVTDLRDLRHRMWQESR